MKQYAVIVAGGSGTRMGGGIPKQFRSLNGHPMLWWSIKAFYEENAATEIIIVLPEEFISLWNDYVAALPANEAFPHIIAKGGSSRSESVSNGLAMIEDEDSLVAVHDGARPLLSKRIISEGWEKATLHGSAIPVVSITDSLRRLKNLGGSEVADRSEYVAVQTPQVFKTGLLKDAYQNLEGKTFTDDASLIESNGGTIHLFEGSPENIKVTNPKDMAVAAVLMEHNA